MGFVPFWAACLAISAAVRTAAAWPSGCPPVEGTFSIDNYRLYPENADWDPVACKLYLSSLFNVSVMVYDPYSKQYDILTFDGLTGNEAYHLSGIDYSPSSQSM